MIALAIALLLMQQPQPWYGGDISGTGGFHWADPMCASYWNDEPVVLPLAINQPEADCTLTLPNGEVFHCTLPQGPITLKSSTDHVAVFQQPERFDVPAVQEWRTRRVCNSIMFPEGGCSGYVTEGYAAWSCADKSRVLLTSEDGVRHCIKF